MTHLFALLSLPLLLLPTLTQAQPRKFRIDGHISHGVTSFNNALIVNFTGSSNLFASYPPLHEIGVTTPQGTNASKIFPDTPLDSIMSNIDAFDFQRTFSFPPGVGPFNLPLHQVPTLFLESTSINDRLTPKTFAQTRNPVNIGLPYLSHEALTAITLRDWNRAAARISGTCTGDTAFVTVRLKNGLPNAVYTLWDIGVTDPLTDDEALSAGPFGGLPNVIVTGRAGRGLLRRRLQYCPFDACPGRQRCTLYVSLFYHFDHMVYAGAPAMDFGGQPIGQVASNQLQIFLNGQRLIEPQTRF